MSEDFKPGKGTNRLQVSITQWEDGEVIFGPCNMADYPGISSALANNLSSAVVDALATTMEAAARVKADRFGQGEEFDRVAEFREDLRKKLRAGAGLKTS